MLLIIIILELILCFIMSSITFCAFMIFLIIILNSFTFMIDFLMVTYHSNHFFDFFNLNRALMSALIASSFNIFLMASSTIFLLYYQLKVLTCYQNLLLNIRGIKLLETIMFRFSIIIITPHQFRSITNQTLAMFASNNSFQHNG